MGLLYITEYQNGALIPVGQLMQAPEEPPVAEQTVAISGTHSESNSFNAATTFVRIHTDSICSLLFGLTPVATTSNQRMVAGQTEYRGVPNGLGYKVSVISNT